MTHDSINRVFGTTLSPRYDGLEAKAVLSSIYFEM